jgi:hypothetical protein
MEGTKEGMTVVGNRLSSDEGEGAGGPEGIKLGSGEESREGH